jgi:C1A family cysteine protease
VYNELFVAGYGYLNGKRVFKFRNSWGTNMGYNGYGYIHINEYCNEITGFIHINGYRNKLSYLIAISIYMNIYIYDNNLYEYIYSHYNPSWYPKSF